MSILQANVEQEVEELLELVFQTYGYDFRNYRRNHIKRRIARSMLLAKIGSIEDLKSRVVNDRAFFEIFLNDLSVGVTEMFRDPEFFLYFRKEIVPYLLTQPTVKVWTAGCSTGEEAYSLAIILEEEGLYERSQIYATDINEAAIRNAKEGIVAASNIRQYTENYLKAGGKKSLADYFTAFSGLARFHKDLHKNILFTTHNLAADSVFGEMQVILCRNVLIYFDRKLQDQAIQTFCQSLALQGYLGLGPNESLFFSKNHKDFEMLSEDPIFYRRRLRIT